MSNNTTLPFDYVFATYIIVQYHFQMFALLIYSKVVWIVVKNRQNHFNSTFYTFEIHLGIAECIWLVCSNLATLFSGLGFPNVLCDFVDLVTMASLLAASILMVFVR